MVTVQLVLPLSKTGRLPSSGANTFIHTIQSLLRLLGSGVRTMPGEVFANNEFAAALLLEVRIGVAD